VGGPNFEFLSFFEWNSLPDYTREPPVGKTSLVEYVDET